MNIYLEILGYIGTILTLMSMMMTSVVKLRTWSAIGSFISMVYAIINGAWPVVFLNVGLIVINVYQLMRMRNNKILFECVNFDPRGQGLMFFLNHHAQDIQYCFPGFKHEPTDDTNSYLVFADGEAVGLLIGKREGNMLNVELDYAIPKFRDYSVASHLFPYLKEQGIQVLVAEARPTDYKQHRTYLTKAGFENRDGKQIKVL